MSIERVLCVALACATLAAVAFGAPAQAREETVTLRGQVVCSSCWFEADRKTTPYGTEPDLKCAARCAKGGVPGALAVTTDGQATLYLLEDGKVTVSKGDSAWTSFAGKQVEVVGSVRSDGDKRYLKVDKLTVVEPSSGD